MNKGKCLCGSIRFSVTGFVGELRYCHCSQCRRLTGSAFSANAKVSARSWRIESGQELVKEYEHTPGIHRAFCSKCGSPIYARLNIDPENIRVRLGTFESVQGADITGHVWVSSKAVWYRIEDTLPRYLKGFTG